ncbi:MAG: transcriptional regulator [Magnetococcales bacterium]|nr:transcriptional regulator [Magnetococcales bacterium]
MRKRFLIVLVLVLLAWPFWFSESARAASSGSLIVFTTEYCPYCKDFMSNVAPSYPKTELGKRFPMVVVDNFSPPKEWEKRAWEIRFYPTFLVLDKHGRERGVFRGYRGEEFFWGELEGVIGRMMAGQ